MSEIQGVHIPKQFQFTLDTINPYRPEEPIVVFQNDKQNVRFYIDVREDDDLIDLTGSTCTTYFKLSDDNVFKVPASLYGKYAIQIDVPPYCLYVPGRVNVEMEFTNTNNEIIKVAYPFYFTVRESINKGLYTKPPLTNTERENFEKRLSEVESQLKTRQFVVQDEVEVYEGTGVKKCYYVKLYRSGIHIVEEIPYEDVGEWIFSGNVMNNRLVIADGEVDPYKLWSSQRISEALSVVNGNLGELFSNELEDSRGTRFVAHRGLSQAYPENSLPSFEAAGRGGFYGIECDLRVTFDDKWVVIHDSTTNRTTNTTYTVANTTLQTLRTAVLQDQSMMYNGKLRIPTLEEYLQVCVDYNTIPVIEIKAYNKSSNLDTLISILRQYRVENKCIIMSFDITLLELLRTKTRNKLQFLTMSASDVSLTTFNRVRAIGNCDVNVREDLLNASSINLAHSLNVKVGSWNVTTYQRAKELHDMNVDYITSDFIGGIR